MFSLLLSQNSSVCLLQLLPFAPTIFAFSALLDCLESLATRQYIKHLRLHHFKVFQFHLPLLELGPRSTNLPFCLATFLTGSQAPVAVWANEPTEYPTAVFCSGSYEATYICSDSSETAWTAAARRIRANDFIYCLPFLAFLLNGSASFSQVSKPA